MASASMLPSLDRYQGCLMGVALGDALCAGSEGGLARARPVALHRPPWRPSALYR